MLRYLKLVDKLIGSLTSGREIEQLSRWGLEHDPLDAKIAAATAHLKPLLDRYGREFSSPGMAVSLRSAVLLAAMCEILQPRRLLDTGSGFSSYVLRYYTRERSDVEVWSVDDNESWLGKTNEYLQAHDSTDSRLLTWDAFARTDLQDFDLIFHDLGHARLLRFDVLPEVYRRLSSNGLLLLDDFHKRSYRVRGRRVLTAAGFTVLPLRHYTLDDLGRYAAMARRSN